VVNGDAKAAEKKGSAKAAANKAVLKSLKDPASAKFGKFTQVKEKACLTINARNSYGGYTGDQQAFLIILGKEWIVLRIENISHESCIEILKSISAKEKDIGKKGTPSPDWVDSFEKTKVLAEQGDAKAQALLGARYDEGEGAAKDKAKAVKWYRKAAKQGIAGAQVNLGVMYLKGEGVAQNSTEAAKWFRKAAEQGTADAQSKLGVMYYMGEGVPQDKVEAAKWLRKAAEQGEVTSQYNLGLMYAKGEGVTKDVFESFEWIFKAAEQGHPKAQAVIEEASAIQEKIANSNSKKVVAPISTDEWRTYLGNILLYIKHLNPKNLNQLRKLAADSWEQASRALKYAETGTSFENEYRLIDAHRLIIRAYSLSFYVSEVDRVLQTEKWEEWSLSLKAHRFVFSTIIDSNAIDKSVANLTEILKGSAFDVF
jgi:hypothetical protein